MILQTTSAQSVGLCCLSAGFCIGIVGDAGVRATGQQPRMFVGMMMMLIFAEVLGEFSLFPVLLLGVVFVGCLGRTGVGKVDGALLIGFGTVAIYGLIVGLLLLTSSENGVTDCGRGY